MIEQYTKNANNKKEMDGCARTVVRIVLTTAVIAGIYLMIKDVVNTDNGYIVEKKQGKIYLDRNNDNLTDCAIDFDKDTMNVLYKYALPGDRLAYTTKKRMNQIEIPSTELKRFFINYKTGKDLIELAQKNKIRNEIGQQKQR